MPKPVYRKPAESPFDLSEMTAQELEKAGVDPFDPRFANVYPKKEHRNEDR